jgi:uncharacterized protein YcbK (DUF882 family)
MGDLSPNFSAKEFACKDCGVSKVSPLLLAGLEEMRQLARLPVIVHDGYRCPEHNKDVGGVGRSEHLEGNAADIDIPPLTLQQMYQIAIKIPQFRNGGIGVYDSNFLHVDVRNHLARWARVAGKYMSIEASGLVRMT